MAKITLDEFSGGLGFGWGNTAEATRYNKSVGQNQIVAGYTSPFVFDKMIVPGITRSGVVTNAVGTLTQNDFPIAFVARDDAVTDSTSGVSVYFASDKNLYIINPSTDTLVTGGSWPVDLYPSANDHALGGTATAVEASMAVDSLVNYQVNGVSKLLAWFRTTTASGNIADFSSWDGTNVVCHDVTTGAPTGLVLNMCNSVHHLLTQVSDNGFMYFGNANRLHKFDGTTSGGALGIVTADVLVLSAGRIMVDMAEMSGKIFIVTKPPTSVYAPHPLSAAWQTNSIGMRPRTCEVLVWNRISTNVNIEDAISIEDCTDVYNIHSTGNRLFIWTLNTNNVFQLRELINGRFKVIADIGKQTTLATSAFLVGAPSCKTAITNFAGGFAWQTDIGDIFWYGSVVPGTQDGLYKIGQNTIQTSADECGGIIALTNGKLYASYFDDSGSAIDISVFKFKDTAQTAIATTVYSAPFELPKLSRVNSITLFFDDTAGNADTGTTTFNIYNSYTKTSAPNKSTGTIDHDVDLARGYLYIPLAMENSNMIQLGLTYPSGKTIAVLPKIHRIEIDYTPTSKLL